jgi:hypothetical protein
MKIEIVSIRNERYVEFFSAVGSGIAACQNTHVVVKEVYHSEFDIDPPIKLNQNAVLVSDQRCFVRFVEDKNEIQGVVEAIDEERFGVIRLAIDCIIMIEIASDEIKEGDYLLLTMSIDEFRVALLRKNLY